MKPIITKFNTSTGDTEIMIAVPYRDPWESHINQPMPAYEEKEHYNIFCLIKENRELKKQLEEMDSKLFFTKNELEMRQKTIDNKLRQQNEFIEWLDSMLVSELDVFTEVKICDVLSKYKEIIGKNIDVSTKEVKNDD